MDKLQMIRESTKNANKVNRRIEILEARHEKQVIKERRDRIYRRIWRAIELAAANGYTDVVVRNLFLKDEVRSYFDDIFSKELVGFKFEVDEMYVTQSTNPISEFVITVSWD